MIWLDWLGENWPHLLEATGIVSGLWFSVTNLSRDANATRVSNLLTLTRDHRELWLELYRRPELARVLDAKADLRHAPVTPDEALFVKLLIQHLHATFQAMREGVFIEVEGMRADVRAFIALPIPHALWPGLRPLQNRDFVAFVDHA
jgi:hypothetical protein